MTIYKWQFVPRFRRNAFGWRSDTPIQRIKEAVAEIKLAAKKEPEIAAEGAVIFLEKLSPAIDGVDSSSGSIGSAVNRAIAILVPIIAKAEFNPHTRQDWLERLWVAVEEDGVPYIESLGDYWGELCVTKETAAAWAERFLSTVEYMWSKEATGHGFYKGTTACMSALLAAGQYERLLVLLEKM